MLVIHPSIHRLVHTSIHPGSHPVSRPADRFWLLLVPNCAGRSLSLTRQALQLQWERDSLEGQEKNIPEVTALSCLCSCASNSEKYKGTKRERRGGLEIDCLRAIPRRETVGLSV